MTRLRQLPIVAIEPKSAEGITSVQADQPAATRLLLSHLAELGHRHLLWIDTDASEKADALRDQAMATARGMDIRLDDARGLIDADANDHDAPAQRSAALARYFGQSHNDAASAAVCANQHAFVALQQALWQTGLRVPDDISIAMLNGTSSMTTPPMVTTVDQQFVQIGRTAAELALQLIEQTEDQRAIRPGISQVVEPALVRGVTTGTVLAPHR